LNWLHKLFATWDPDSDPLSNGENSSDQLDATDDVDAGSNDDDDDNGTNTGDDS
jgi:hypothetical protein